MGHSGSDDDLVPHQTAWTREEMVDKFAVKTPEDFFRTERHFLADLAPTIGSVVDVGCASGRFVELLSSLGANDFRFFGIDLVEASIEAARRAYPTQEFVTGDLLALDLSTIERADLVNATGVMQHEPRYLELVDAMIQLSNRHVLFDLKLAAIEGHLIDIDRSFVTIGDDRLYYIVYDLAVLLRQLVALAPRLTAVSVFGYETPPNQRTTVVDDIGSVASAGMLLTLASQSTGQVQVELSLPPFLGNEHLAEVARSGIDRSQIRHTGPAGLPGSTG